MPLAAQQKAGCIIGKDYPEPIVEHATAYAKARRRIHALKRTPEARAESKKVYVKHGSRRKPGVKR
jgi:deoxyribodipyrimidine photo-lyase